MGERGGKPNLWLWALLFAAVAGVLAAVGHAFTAYHAVTGYEFDWLEWPRQAVLSPEAAATTMAMGTFLFTFLTAAIAGAVTYALAKRGKLRGVPSKGGRRDKAWSEFSATRSLGLASLGAIVLGLLAWAVAEYEIGGLFPGRGGIDGPEFFLFAVISGTIVAILAVVSVTRSIGHTYARGHIVEQHPDGNMISRIQLASARNAPAVLVVVILLTAALGFGITKITTDVDVADVLPRGNGNTSAAQNVTTQFKSTFTQQVTLQLTKNPEQCRADSQRVLPNRPGQQLPNQPGGSFCHNITDEVYVRAQDELFQFILDEQDLLQFHIGLSSFYNLINWTIAGGQNASNQAEAFSLPPTDRQGELRYAQVNATVWNTVVADAAIAVIDPSFDQMASLYLVSTAEEATTQEIGRTALDVRDAYVQAVENDETLYKVWGADNPPIFTVDIPVANAHSSDLAKEDFVTLFPIIFAFIVVTLYFSFRNFTAIGIAGGTLLVATVWTYGTMGHMDIALNSLNLTVLPLILGVGIDFSIHQITEFSHHKSEGLSDEEALQISGGFAGFAMFLATVTSGTGLLVMTISPSLLMAQLGFLSAMGIISVYLLTITFIPALLALAKSSDDMGAKFEPSDFMAGMVRALSRRRIAVGLLVLAITGVTAIGTTNLGIEEFGEPALNFPEDDPLRREHVEGLQGFYDLDEGGEILKTNIVVFEGDNTDLQSHRYMDALQAEMGTKPNLNLDTSRNLPFLMRTWMTVKDGGPGAIEQIGRDTLTSCQAPGGQMIPGCSPVDRADSYPRTRQAIIHELDAMFASPLSTFSSLFVDHPDYNISIMTLATTTGSFEEAEAAWNDVWDSVAATEGGKPHDLRVSFVGNTATNFLFIEEELPWLSYLAIVSGIVVTLLTIMFTKSIRATMAVVLVVGATSLWWLGILPSVDIGLAITLMLPAVFITSIGADYALHMTWNLLKNPDRQEVYGVVGKAVMYSAITDIGAFAIFTQTQNVAASKAMVATVIAIAVMFLATVLILALFYPLTESEDDASLDYVPTTRVTEGPPAGPPPAGPEPDTA